MSFIHVQHLCKRFIVRKKRRKGALLREKETVRALEDVSFDVEQGELIGYIGPNGAGKSTTVKILSGILTPDGGEARVGGQIPWKNRREYVKGIGVVFGQRMQLWWDVPILDSYGLLKDIYRIPDPAYEKRLRELTEALNLGDLLRTPLRQMSLGQRMRAELCGSLLHQPRTLFLDEPTIGLDAVSKQAVRGFVREINREGVTVLLTTHDTADLEALADRILLLGHGQLLFDGQLADLRARYETEKTLTVHYTGAAPAGLPPDCTVLQCAEGMLALSVPAARSAAVLTALASQLALTDVQVEARPIDEVIAALYRKFRSLSAMDEILSALRPVVVALIAAAGLKVLIGAIFREGALSLSAMDIPAAVCFAASVLLLRRAKWNPILTMFACGAAYTLIALALGA